MPDLTVNTGPEAFLYLSSAAQTLVSIDLADVATELGTAVQLQWEEIGFVRNPINWSEPVELFDIYKHFDIDHTKKGRQQRKGFSFTAAYRHASQAVRKYHNKECLVKLEWHIEGIGTVDEYEYFKSVRFLNYSRESPDGEAIERIDAIFSKWGHRDGP